MGAGHVPELCCAVLDPTFGSMHVGHRRGTKCPDPVWKRSECSRCRWKSSVQAVVACMFSQRIFSAWRNLFVLRSKDIVPYILFVLRCKVLCHIY